jgi:predicted metalloprotease with PDZ domain
MWQRLHDGFVRGRKNRRPDLSLAELSPSMRENRSYMRVYWSGAWYFFRADMELRRRSAGRQTLDTALAALNACCADAALSARDIAIELDRLTGQLLFVPLFDQVAASRALPPFEEQFAALGIVLKDGRVSLQNTHPSAGIRSTIARQVRPQGD